MLIILRQFHLRLKKLTRSQFESGYFIVDDKKVDSQEILNQIYEGILEDEPNESHVSGVLIDGHFYGKISSLRRGIYFIESVRPYHIESSDSILYNVSDIDSEKLNLQAIDKLPYNLNSKFWDIFSGLKNFKQFNNV